MDEIFAFALEPGAAAVRVALAETDVPLVDRIVEETDGVADFRHNQRLTLVPVKAI